jgi:adenosylcobinamide-phosphate synthase
MTGRGGAAAFALLAGMALDEALGDPARWHPVAGFGRLALAGERMLYRPSRAAGAVYAALGVGLPAVAAAAVQRRVPRAPLATGCLVVALGGRTLRRTAVRMAELVERGDLDAARALAPSLVSRQADELDGPQLLRAALESLAENTADAVGGPLVWTAIAGAPGAVAYRAANTLDAMVGYRSERYARFGWAAARLDDALNWPVARLTAAATVVAAPLAGADAPGAWHAWRRDSHRHPSPNAGRVEAAFAGALGVRLGGASRYGDAVEHRPELGDGPPPDAAAVRRAARLSGLAGWLLAVALMPVAARRARGGSPRRALDRPRPPKEIKRTRVAAGARRCR